MRKPYYLLKNERGDALVVAMIMAVACTMTGLAIMQYTSDVAQNSRRPRVKSMMMATEAKVRELLLTPASYTGCESASSRSSCTLAPSVFTSLKRSVTGAQCANGAGCGISVTGTFQNIDASHSSASAKATIHYEGKEMSLADVTVEMVIPVDVIQSTGRYTCPPGSPKFLGFESDGRIKCRALPPTAAPGFFVEQITLSDLSMTTGELHSTIDCSGSGGIIGHVKWGSGGTVFDATCMARPDPFTEFGFAPGKTSTDPSYVTNPD